MALQVLGSGMGRTGTMSLKLALEQLGFGKTYHMFELFQHPENVTYFKQAERGEDVEWPALFGNEYQSAVDYPIARYYKQILAKYPNIKVVHTQRDPESWYKSASETIFWATKPDAKRKLELILKLPFSSTIRKRFKVLLYDGDLIDKEFGKNLKNKDEVIHRYNAHNEEVIKTVPAKQLLLFDVKQGWEPLCKYLNVPVPSNTFPKSKQNKSTPYLENSLKIITLIVLSMIWISRKKDTFFK